ncbi:MAG: hypothetical protein C4575_11050 [Desulforudis sp.]|jgi:O-antigen/teichoic acid export membrane protein|nr:MAG: hypothetical protein C4575_11050 [Desulforudis sp.]
MHLSLNSLKAIGHDHLLRELFLKSTFPFVVRIVGVVSNLGFTYLISRILGASGAGVFFLSLTVLMVATVLSRAGLDNSVLRLIASAAGGGRWALVACVYRNSLGIAFCLALLISLVVYSFSDQIAISIFGEPDMGLPLRWMTLAIVPFSLLVLQAEAFKAVAATSVAIFLQNTGITLGCFLTLAVLQNSTLAAHNVCQIYGVSCLVVFLGAVYLWRRKVPQHPCQGDDCSARSLLRVSAPLFWVSVLNLLMGWMDTIVLGVWHDSSVVGIYGIANRVAALLGLLLAVVNSVVAPRFSSLFHEGKLNEIQSLFSRSVYVMIILGFPVLIIYFLFAEQILNMFGNNFGAAAVVLKILSAGQFVNIATGSVGYLLMMTGHEKIMRNNIFLACMVNIILNMTLVPYFGAVGAATATAATVISLNLASLYFVKRKLGVSLFG